MRIPFKKIVPIHTLNGTIVLLYMVRRTKNNENKDTTK